MSDTELKKAINKNLEIQKLAYQESNDVDERNFHLTLYNQYLTMFRAISEIENSKEKATNNKNENYGH